MNKDDIIRMAREAGIVWDDHTVVGSRENLLERFANLAVAAAKAEEREACAKVCEDASKPRDDEMHSGLQWAGLLLAAAIRARGQQ